MSTRKLFGPVIVLLAACVPAAALADAASHRQSVEKLFELTAMQQKIDESVDSVLALQLTQSPGLRDHESAVREFLERHIGWNSMRDALTDMYLQEFSEQEMNEMIAFYSSKTGQKVIERLPVLVQMRNQLASKRLQENIGELHYQIEGHGKKQAQP
ncbi:MAG: DUF2059 domain-containing protein [Gammaproteobacteria bacterium]|nr:DUF2059 domain-containing protein [Gammaproteobacteria bacterium]MDH5514219.1 DUF2059 domain-containing protein [Gammaproteobacteria bacterium]